MEISKLSTPNRDDRSTSKSIVEDIRQAEPVTCPVEAQQRPNMQVELLSDADPSYSEIEESVLSEMHPDGAVKEEGSSRMATKGAPENEIDPKLTNVKTNFFQNTR